MVKRLLTKRDVEKYLQVLPRKVDNLVAASAFPVCRIGRQVRINPSDLGAYIESTKQGPEQQLATTLRRPQRRISFENQLAADRLNHLLEQQIGKKRKGS